MHLYYEITNRCNLACTYCYNDCNNNIEMEKEEIQQVLTELKYNYNLESITFSGGEPLCYENLQDILYFCKKKLLLHTKIITNGKYLKNQGRMFWENVDGVTISIHDLKERKYDYIFKYKSNVDFGFQVVVNKNNIRKLTEYIKISEEYDVPLSFIEQKARGRGKNDDLLEIEEVLQLDAEISQYNNSCSDNRKKIKEIISNECKVCPCSVARSNSFTMKSNGDIYLCTELEENYVVGSKKVLLNESINNAAQLISQRSKKYQEKYCEQCVLQEVCVGLCPGHIDSDANFSKICKCRIYKALYKVG